MLDTIARWTAGSVAAVVTLVVLGAQPAAAAQASSVSGIQTSVSSAVTTLGSDLVFVPVAPVRLLDTREENEPAGKPVGTRATRDLVVTGTAGVPADAKAVTLNVTVTGATAATFVRVWPTGAAMPDTSSLNTVPGTDAASGVWAGVGTGGKVSFYNNAGTTHLVVDVSGYFVAKGGLKMSVPTSPVRAYDSRTTGGILVAGKERTVQVAGVKGIPSDAKAVVANVTSAAASDVGNIAVWPTGAHPGISSVNNVAGGDVSNRTVIPLDSDGKVKMRLAGSSAHVVLDVVGWFSPTGTLTFTPIVPERAVDTRATGDNLGQSQPRSTNLATTSVPSDAKALLVTMTATGQTSGTWVSVWGAGTKPDTSDLNTAPGRDQAAMTIVRSDKGGQVVYNNAGTTSLVFDTVGFFRGSVPSASGPYDPTSQPLAPDAAKGSGDTLDVYVAPGGNGNGLSKESPVGTIEQAQVTMVNNGGKTKNVNVWFAPGTYRVPGTSWWTASKENRIRFLPYGYTDGSRVCPLGRVTFVSAGSGAYWLNLEGNDSNRADFAATRIDVRCMSVTGYPNGVRLSGGYEYHEPGKAARGKGPRLSAPRVTGMTFDGIGTTYSGYGDGYAAVHLQNTDSAVVQSNGITSIRNRAPMQSYVHAVYAVYSTSTSVAGNWIVGGSGDAVRARSSSTVTLQYNTISGFPAPYSVWTCDAACATKNKQSIESGSTITVR